VNEHARSAAQEREGGAMERAREYVVRTEAAEESEEAPPILGADHPAVIAEPATEVLTLTVGEATMRLDLSGAPVLMFRRGASGVLNVVYRRADGHIGWIDPGQ